MGWAVRQDLGQWARWSILAALLALPIAEAATPARVNDLRLWSGPEGTRLVVDLSSASRFKVFTLENPNRVVIDLQDAKLASKAMPTGQGPVRRVRTGARPGNDLRIVLDTIGALEPRSFAVD